MVAIVGAGFQVHSLWLCPENGSLKQEKKKNLEMRVKKADRATEQQAKQHRLHNNDFISIFFSLLPVQCSQAARWYVGAGDCGTMRTLCVLQSKILHERMLVAMTRERKPDMESVERWQRGSFFVSCFFFLFFLPAAEEMERCLCIRHTVGRRGSNRGVSRLEFSGTESNKQQKCTLYSH